MRPVLLAWDGAGARTTGARTASARARTSGRIGQGPFVALQPPYALLKTAGKAIAGEPPTHASNSRDGQGHSRLAPRQGRQDLRRRPRRRRREPRGKGGRVHCAARPQRRRQDHAVPAALRAVHRRFRNDRGDGARHGARSGAGAGAARYRIPAADARPRAFRHGQSPVSRRPARPPARARTGAHRQGTGAARARRARPRQGGAALGRQSPAHRTGARLAAPAEPAPDGRADRGARSAEPQRPPQAHFGDARRAPSRGALGHAPLR